MLKRLTVASGLLLAACCAAAWESERPTPFPILHGTLPDGVHFNSARVDISGLDVAISYEVVNRGTAEAFFTLSNYSDPAGRVGLLDEDPDKTFSELTLAIAGERVKPRLTSAFFFNGKDVTGDLKRAGVDGLKALIDDRSRLLWSPKAIRQLERFGLIQSESPAMWPRWFAVVAKAWSIRLAPQQLAVMQVRFRARPGLLLTNSEALPFKKLVGSHCANPSEAVRALADEAQGKRLDDVVLREFVIPVRVAGWAPETVGFEFHDSGDAAKGRGAVKMLSCDWGHVTEPQETSTTRITVIGDSIGFVLLSVPR